MFDGKTRKIHSPAPFGLAPLSTVPAPVLSVPADLLLVPDAVPPASMDVPLVDLPLGITASSTFTT